MAKPRKRTEFASGLETPDRLPDDARHIVDSGDDPHDRVAIRAYELYLARGGGDGGDFDDWLAAEREIGGNGSASKGDAGE